MLPEPELTSVRAGELAATDEPCGPPRVGVAVGGVVGVRVGVAVGVSVGLFVGVFVSV